MSTTKRRRPQQKRQSKGLIPRNQFPPSLRQKMSFLSTHEDHDSFFARVGEIFPPTDERYKLIHRAYEVAKAAFKNKVRDSGERYFEHLRGVALILLVYLRVVDPIIIAAALLHDIVEDIDGWDVARVEREFGPRVAELVWWLSKPTGKRFRTEGDRDRKYHRNLERAPREAVIIKLADRLHNLLTIWKQPKTRIHKKMAETHNFILPLAERHTILIHEIEDALRFLELRFGSL